MPHETNAPSLLDPAISSDPYDFYAHLQQQQPVYKIPETGAYVITKYDDLRHVLKNYDAFSSNVTVSTPGDSAQLKQSILRDKGWEHIPTLQRTDPPQHARYRKLLDRVFTNKRVREMTPYIDRVAHEIIDGFADQAYCEFNNDFAMPMPGIIIAEQLGLAPEEVHTFKRWADAMLGAGRSTLSSEANARTNIEIELEAQHYLAKVFEERRLNPKDDLISGLVHAHGDDEAPLSVHELQNLMHQLITGGFETTQSAINHGMWTLVRYPELQTLLREDPSQMKRFVEEVLRWESPVQFLARQTTREVEISGTVIPADTLVLVGYGPANRDATKFTCPETFDITRANAGANLAFGSGPHFCVGALLARQEMASAFSALVTRLDSIKLAQPLTEPVHHFSLFFMPMRELPITWQQPAHGGPHKPA